MDRQYGDAIGVTTFEVRQRSKYRKSGLDIAFPGLSPCAGKRLPVPGCLNGSARSHSSSNHDGTSHAIYFEECLLMGDAVMRGFEG